MSPKDKLNQMVSEARKTGVIYLSSKLQQAFSDVEPALVRTLWFTCANMLLQFIDTQPHNIYALMFAPDGHSCKRGCSHCCHVNVDIFPFEADRMWALYKRDKDEVIEVQSKFGQKDYLVSPREKSACVFLKNNECSIYEQRPYACRNLYVFTPPEYCDERANPGAQSAQYVNLKGIILESIVWSIFDFQSIPKHFNERIKHDQVHNEPK